MIDFALNCAIIYDKSYRNIYVFVDVIEWVRTQADV